MGLVRRVWVWVWVGLMRWVLVWVWVRRVWVCLQMLIETMKLIHHDFSSGNARFMAEFKSLCDPTMVDEPPLLLIYSNHCLMCCCCCLTTCCCCCELLLSQQKAHFKAISPKIHIIEARVQPHSNNTSLIQLVIVIS